MPTIPRARALDGALELMYYGFTRLVAAPDRVLARQRLNRSHHRILYFVARRPGLAVGELLAALRVTKQALHGPLRELVRRDLVRVGGDGRDRRVRRLVLSPRGLALERRLTTMQHRHLAGVLEAAGPRAEAGWRLVMRRLGAVGETGMQKSARAASRPPDSRPPAA